MSLGEPREHHATIGSTNERARELAEEGAAHGTLVTADEQTAGRRTTGVRGTPSTTVETPLVLFAVFGSAVWLVTVALLPTVPTAVG